MSFPNLSALAVRERALTLFFIVLAILGGAYAFSSLGRAEDPAFVIRALAVSATWPGASTKEMQEQVVDKLEKRLQEIDYLYRIDTTIRPGRADLIVEFHDYSPASVVPALFYEVRKRMADEAPRLPKGVAGPFVNDDFADVYFSLIAVSAPGLPMRELTRETEGLRDRLQNLDGVHKALLLGERPERLYLDFDTTKLANMGLAPQAVFDAIEASNALAPAGFADLAGPRAYLRIDADLSDPGKLASLPIRIGDRLLRLGDIAKVQRGYQEPPAYLVRNRGEDALLLGVVMRKGENGLTFGSHLKQWVERENRRLPLGMHLTVLTNQADAIEQAVNLFQGKFIVAVAVVMAVSVLAIGLRAGLVVGIAIPLTLGITFLLMKLTNVNLDRITLGALIIALGLLVDDAIIAIEMMVVKLEEGWDRVRAASHAWSVTAAPMLYGTLVTAAGFVPIGFARSGVGEYAGNIFWVLAYALLVSWLVAVTFTPYLGVKVLKERAQAPHALYDSPAYQRLRALVHVCVRRRKTVVAGTVGVLVLSIAGMATVVEKQFFPGSDRPEVLVAVYLPQGSSIATTDATVRRLEALIAPMPEVKSLASYVGGGAPRFFISANPEMPDPAFAKLVAITNGPKDRDRVMAALEKHVADGEFPEARIRVTRLLYGPPVIWPVSLRVSGPDPVRLRELGHAVRQVMAANPHTHDAHLEWDERMPVLRLAYDDAALRLAGLTPRDVARQLQFQLDGVAVSEARQGIRTVEIRARGARGTLPIPEALELRTQDGRKVALAQLGRLEVGYEEPVVRRLNREPYVAVHADVRGAQPPDVSAAVWRALAPVRDKLPEGYHIEVGGSVEQSSKADGSIQKLQPVMVALMLLFVMLQMRSFSGMFMVVATAPLGLVGAVVALLLFRQPFGFVALLGLIGLAGILMRNTMILTQQVQDNFVAGLQPTEAVVEAAVRRARPVLLTALAAALAFVPLTLDSFWGPLAYVLIGGVVIGTLITLLFVPALYALWFRLPVAAR